ncbi:cytochrome c1 [Halomonas sp. 18H]|uniref:cytochrome c1 n=1 Tax=Halomonas almeriensis TaxID=308163 RepID=UPI00222F1939|nr:MULTISPECIES: cytochrome c1 [Halomonas]MCW4151647.1 cytochrome c1 [Halomonas sp. 18H]MDN3552784.1 cytochrome c1 [Halomonas almeriensis]
MKKSLLILCVIWLPMTALAAGGDTAGLRSMTPALQDKASLQNGMQLFVNYCMGCHSLQYQRFSRAAEDLDIPRGLVEDHLILAEEQAFNDQMQIAMDAQQSGTWFGKAPPDLTLVTRLRSSDWLYSYLLSFYRDAEQPTGVNNSVFPAVAMPNVLEPLQGVQQRVCHDGDCQLELVEQGRLSPDAFERAMFDLTNFLVYVGEPSRLKAQALAPKVLIFLAVFALLAYFLKREYWRDIH